MRAPSSLRVSLLTAVALTLACQAAEDPPDSAVDPTAGEPDSEWTELFNGRDLTGWVPKIRGEPLTGTAKLVEPHRRHWRWGSLRSPPAVCAASDARAARSGGGGL